MQEMLGVGFNLPSRTPLRHNHTEVCLDQSPVYFAAVCLTSAAKSLSIIKMVNSMPVWLVGLFKGGSCAEAVPYDW